MNTIVTKAKIQKNQNVDISSTDTDDITTKAPTHQEYMAAGKMPVKTFQL